MKRDRLNEIKKWKDDIDLIGCEVSEHNFYTIHIEWLIEQAEKAQELEKYYISEKRLKELLNGNEDIGELYQFVEDNQKIEDVISMIIKEMGYLAGALDDYNKGFFELEKQNKRYREVLKGVLKILDSDDWSKYDASALQDNIDDYITLENIDLLEESE